VSHGLSAIAEFLVITGRLPWQPAGIKFTQCVSGQKSAFSPLQEKLCVGSKNDLHLLELSRRSLSACSVWGDRTTRAGCRIENWCFFDVTLGLPARGGQSSNKYCVAVYGSILKRFSELFQNVLLFQMRYILLIFFARWRHIFRKNCSQKLRKVQKLAEKFVHTTSYT